MFFFEFGQIMGWAFWAAVAMSVLGAWMVLFSNAITAGYNFIHDQENREYRWWYERMIMEDWGGCTWDTTWHRWTTDNHKNYCGPTDDSDKPFRGDKRFAYWFGTGLVYAMFYFPGTLILGVCAYLWPLALPIMVVWLVAIYLRGVVRRNKAKATEVTTETVAEEAA